MAGISYYIQSLHDGVRQCILSVGTHCQANANGATSSFMFKRTRAFCHNDTPATDAIGEELWQLVKGKPGTMVAVCTPQMVYEQTSDPEQQAQAQHYRDVFLSNKCASAQAQSSSLPPDNIGGGGALRNSAAVGRSSVLAGTSTGESVFMLKTDLSSVHQTRSVTTSSNGLRTRSGAGGGSAVQREGTRSLRPRGDDVRERNDQGNYVVSKSGASVGPTTASTLLAVSHTEASFGNRLSTTGSESSHAGRSTPSTSVSNMPIQVASSDRGTARRTGALDTRGSGSVVWTRAVNGTITSSTYRGPTSLNCGGTGVSTGLTASAALDCRGVSSGVPSNSGASKSSSSFGSGREMDSWHESSARPNSVKSSSAVSRNNPTVGIRVWSHRTSAAANFTSVSSAINRERAASRRFNESSARSGVSRHEFPNWNEPTDGCDGYFNRNGPPNLKELSCIFRLEDAQLPEKVMGDWTELIQRYDEEFKDRSLLQQYKDSGLMDKFPRKEPLTLKQYLHEKLISKYPSPTDGQGCHAEEMQLYAHNIIRNMDAIEKATTTMQVQSSQRVQMGERLYADRFINMEGKIVMMSDSIQTLVMAQENINDYISILNDISALMCMVQIIKNEIWEARIQLLEICRTGLRLVDQLKLISRYTVFFEKYLMCVHSEEEHFEGVNYRMIVMALDCVGHIDFNWMTPEQSVPMNYLFDRFNNQSA